MSGAVQINDEVLDDPVLIEQADPQQMLREIASSGAQVRQAAVAANEAGLDRLVEDGRPRALVVLGMGGSAIAGDVLSAVVGSTSPVPIVAHRGYDLPAWVGAADLVVAVSCSGTTQETLSAFDAAVGRGCRLMTVGAADSPLSQRAEQARAPHIPVPQGRQPRASVWSLAVPLLVAADRLRIGSVPEAALEATAELLARYAERCRPSSEQFVNPAKSLARELAGSVPMVWGTSDTGAVAAYRFACQLAENAKYPAVYGALPEANHNQVVTFAGPFARSASSVEDFFRDRVDEPESPTGLRLVLLRDSEEHPKVAARAVASVELAGEYGVPVTEIVAEGSSALERLASLVVLGDYASAYLAIALGIDPTPVAPIVTLKERI